MEPTPTESKSSERIAYFEKHAIPWLLEHIKMRSIGLQIFTAIQGALMLGWSTHPSWPLPLLGLASCLSFYLWDSRNRYVFRSLHRMGEEIVDRHVFGAGRDGRALRGVHKFFTDALASSGRSWPRLADFASHTWAIRIMLIVATLAWLLALFIQSRSPVTAVPITGS
jgi:hypothetical protein